MKHIYTKKQFDVYKSDDGYVIHNREMKDFAHSHLDNYKTCLYLIDLSLSKKLPQHLPRYLIVSLLRINSDEKYVRKIQELLDNKKEKAHYYNSNKGVRGKFNQK